MHRIAMELKGDVRHEVPQASDEQALSEASTPIMVTKLHDVIRGLRRYSLEEGTGCRVAHTETGVT